LTFITKTGVGIDLNPARYRCHSIRAATDRISLFPQVGGSSACKQQTYSIFFGQKVRVDMWSCPTGSSPRPGKDLLQPRTRPATGMPAAEVSESAPDSRSR